MSRKTLIFQIVIFFGVGYAGEGRAEDSRIQLIEGRASVELPTGMLVETSVQHAPLGKLSSDGHRIVFVDEKRTSLFVAKLSSAGPTKNKALLVPETIRSLAKTRSGMRVLDSGTRLIGGAHAGYASYEAPGIKDGSVVSLHYVTYVDLPEGTLQLVLRCPVANRAICKRYAAQISQSLIITTE